MGDALRMLPNLHGWLGFALPTRDSLIPPLCGIQSTNAIPHCGAAERSIFSGMGRVYDDLNSSILSLIQQIAKETPVGVRPP
jgi:hypothetical protein